MFYLQSELGEIIKIALSIKKSGDSLFYFSFLALFHFNSLSPFSFHSLFALIQAVGEIENLLSTYNSH
jgi:hypothetical protein